MAKIDKTIKSHINALALKLVRLRIHNLKAVAEKLKRKKDGNTHDHNHRHTG